MPAVALVFRAPVFAPALAGSACSGGPTALPALPGASAEIKLDPRIEPSVLPVSSTEAYARIARGANTCWFGPTGRLAANYIFHADAAPAMNGGGVEIIVHERARDQPKPWGYKAFRITITETVGADGNPNSGTTRMDVENIRMAEDEASRMRAEAFQWATGNEGCQAVPQATAAVQGR